MKPAIASLFALGTTFVSWVPKPGTKFRPLVLGSYRKGELMPEESGIGKACPNVKKKAGTILRPFNG